ncbi:unnamed protein product [Amoebophrya sp. A120]|nr:unnamed protein product [Amoebophrya sp. A120]|eukprot:GSA120T00021769001.1
MIDPELAESAFETRYSDGNGERWWFISAVLPAGLPKLADYKNPDFQAVDGARRDRRRRGTGARPGPAGQRRADDRDRTRRRFAEDPSGDRTRNYIWKHRET